MNHRYVKGSAVAIGACTWALAASLTAPAVVFATPANLAQDKPVTVSNAFATLPAKNLTDSDKASRWSAEQAPAQWAYVDLEGEKTFDTFEVTWENDAEHAVDFNIYVSNSTSQDGWGKPVKRITGNKERVSKVKLDSLATGRYVKLEITKVSHYQNVSACDFTIMNSADDDGSQQAQDPAANVALKMTGVSDSKEADTLGPNNLFDGKVDKRESRWSSASASESACPTTPHWVYVDLGQTRDVKTVRLFWEQRKAKGYKIQLAQDGADLNQESSWVDAYTNNDHPVAKTETITLGDTAKQARYVRLYINGSTYSDPDGGTAWGTVSLYEMEVYGGEPATSMGDMLSGITVNGEIDPAKNFTDQITLPKHEGYQVTYNGTDYEQVIDADGTIYQPIVDTKVKASFKVVNEKTKAYSFREVEVTVPGSMKGSEQGEAAPVILPELREWKGGTGRFAAFARVTYKDASLKEMAEQFASDYRALTGRGIEVAKADAAQAGDVFFTLGADKKRGLKEEGYLIEATSDKITVSAEAVAGANWGSKTILQSVKQTDDFPCGTARDYPLHKVRGFILDVGRKTFTIEWLRQLTDQMSWYKMNDLQIHLNDNLIPLEQLKDPMQAYSAFRLESDVKAGEGKNQADLTAKDVWYTKKDFKAYIEHSRALGVNIIPEIDTPAHSLALTKVRPDLRHGTTGRATAHLDLKNQYDESLSFVQGIFDEYVQGGDAAVFADADVVHIGADEYNADGNAYRRFVNDMFKYAEDNGKTARVWGSLSEIKGDVEVKGVSETGKRRQMNLWNPGWADMKSMYDLGFELIDCQDGVFYIVPNAGYYYDYLNQNSCYNDKVNEISGFEIPAGDPQISGGAFAVWNDMCDFQENGMSEYDIYRRIDGALGLFAANTWGKTGAVDLAAAQERVKQLGDAPSTNFGYEQKANQQGSIAHLTMDSLDDASGQKHTLGKMENVELESVDGRQALHLNGGKSFAKLDGLETAGLGNSLRVKVKRTDNSKDEQVLFESPYGKIMAVQEKTGKVGITRENRAYSFNYALPANQWVELEFKNEFEKTHLYVDGKLVDTIGTNTRAQIKATCMLPVGTVGSESGNAFAGYVDDIRLGTAKDFNSTMPLDHAVVKANLLASKNSAIKGDAELQGMLSQAAEIFRQYDPSADAIADLAAKIEAKLDAAGYKKADYGRIDAYLTIIPADLSEYEDADARAVAIARDSIVRNMSASQQDVVDNYEKSLISALDELKLKPVADLSVVDPALLKATADRENGDGEAASALDGNTGSIWHSRYSPDKCTGQHHITLSSEQPLGVDGIVYTPRQTGTNGDLKKYEVHVSADGKTFKKVADGTIKNLTRDPYLISFERQDNVRAVKLVYVEGEGGFASAAELRLHDANAVADTAALKAQIAAAEAVKQGEGVAVFSSQTYDALTSKIAEAKALAQGSPTINDANAMRLSLMEAILNLRLEGAPAPTPDPEPQPPVTPQPPAKDDIEIPAHPGGKVEVSPKNPDAGDKVTVYPKPQAGKEVRSISVTDKDGNKVEVRKNEKGEFEFTMPQGDVEVNVVFGCDGGDLCETHKFADIDASQWYHDPIDWALEKGYLRGYEGTNLMGPTDTTSRAQFVAMLARAAGADNGELDGKGGTFGDVNADDWFAGVVAWGAENGIVSGYDGTNDFGPDHAVTREQVAVFLMRFAQKNGVDTSGRGDLSKFPDAGKVSDFAGNAMKWAVEEGFIKGLDSGELKPGDVASRAEVATILMRYFEAQEQAQ